MKSTSRVILFAVIAAFFAGCASVNFDYPKSESHTIQDTGDTYLGVHVSDVAVDKPLPDPTAELARVRAALDLADDEIADSANTRAGVTSLRRCELRAAGMEW